MWIKIDDGFADHPKLMALGHDRLPCIGIHVAALCYCARHLTDGLIPREFAGQFSHRLVFALVDTGLWEEDGRNFRIHDYLSYNPSRQSVENEREQARERMKLARSSRNVRPKFARSSDNPVPVPVPDVLTEHSNGEEWDGRSDLEAWLLVKHRIPTPRQREWLDRYCDTFDVTGPQRAAKIILSHPDDPIAALKADRDAFLHERAEAITVEPKPSSHRSGSGLTGVSAELAKLWREQTEGEA